jgi:purine-binding chemotaxis protein CheW
MNVELTLTDLGNPADQRNLVVFRLDRQTYALPIEPIVQIIEMVTITPIPQISNTVEGVINVRGVPILVVNLRRHLGLPEATLQLHTPIVLAQIGESMVGLIVDEVLDVLSLPGGQITRPADVLLEGLGEAPIFQGLVHSPDGMMLLLDLEHLFLPHQVQVLAQAVETPPEVVVEGVSGEPPADTRLEIVVEEAFEDVGAALAAAPAEVEPKPDRKRRKKRWPTTLRQAQDAKVSKETHLDGSDREVGT